MCVLKPHTDLCLELFQLGQVAITPGALELVEHSGTNACRLLQRHQSGDFGDLPLGDVDENLRAIKEGCRIMSSYFLTNLDRIWIITEADRSATTILLPNEY